MPYKQVKKEMEILHARLAKTQANTQKLELAIQDAQQGIDSYTPEVMADFVQFVKDETEALELEHPDLREFVSRLMITLSNIGI